MNEQRVEMEPDEADVQEEAIVIDPNNLSPDALRGVVEHFVLREGTEYGASEFPLESKVAQVMRQLERGEAQIVFDPKSESVDVIVRARFSRSTAGG